MLLSDCEIGCKFSNGVYRDMEETLCERLVDIWRIRRANPQLLTQPASQWDAKFKPCDFQGYAPGTKQNYFDRLIGHPTLERRMVSVGTDDQHRHIWNNSPWE